MIPEVISCLNFELRKLKLSEGPSYAVNLVDETNKRKSIPCTDALSIVQVYVLAAGVQYVQSVNPALYYCTAICPVKPKKIPMT